MFNKQTSDKNFYEILEISRNADSHEIKNAFKRLALKYHPDKVAFSKISPEKAEALFKELNNAFETLSTPYKRLSYDIHLHSKINSKASHNHHFWHQKQPAQSFNKPKEVNKKEMNDLIKNDESDQLDLYLKKNNFGSQSLLNELLLSAAKQGSLNIVKYLIEVRDMNPRRIFIDSFYFNGSIFKYAAASGNLDLVKYLLEEHKADIESQATRSQSGCCGTALSYAARKGHVHIVGYLIQKGANVNPEVSYSDILKKAIQSQNVAVVKLLIEAGTILNDYHLEEAFERGYLDIAQYILQIRPGIHNHQFLNSTPAGSVIQSGNLDLLKYLEQHEKLELFLPVEYSKNIAIVLLAAAARSGNKNMMFYLLEEKGLLSECQKPETANKYIQAILNDAVKEDGFQTKKVKVQERLALVRYLMEDKKFILPAEELIHVIQLGAKFSSIEMNTYLESYLPDLESHRNLLLSVAFQGLSNLSHEEVFSLFNLNMITKEHNDFEDEIHDQIENRHISNDELKWLISNSDHFKKDALFYYSNYRCENDLSQLQTVIDSGIDIDDEDSRGVTTIEYAMHQGGYNTIVKLLIDKGANVYKKDYFGKSIYDRLNTNSQFHDQLERLHNKDTEYHVEYHDAPQPTNISFKW